MARPLRATLAFATPSGTYYNSEHYLGRDNWKNRTSTASSVCKHSLLASRRRSMKRSSRPHAAAQSFRSKTSRSPFQSWNPRYSGGPCAPRGVRTPDAFRVPVTHSGFWSRFDRGMREPLHVRKGFTDAEFNESDVFGVISALSRDSALASENVRAYVEGSTESPLRRQRYPSADS